MKYKISFEKVTASKVIFVEADNIAEAEDKALRQLSIDDTPDQEEIVQWVTVDVEKFIEVN
jgi:hypothetical protein